MKFINDFVSTRFNRITVLLGIMAGILQLISNVYTDIPVIIEVISLIFLIFLVLYILLEFLTYSIQTTKLLKTISEKWPSKKNDASVSVMGLMLVEREKQRKTITIVLLIAGFVYILIELFFSLDLTLGPIILITAIVFLTWINNKLLLNRILSGQYGSNEQEAREMIQFILNNLDDTKNGGGPRRLNLSEEELQQYVKEIESELGLEEVAK